MTSVVKAASEAQADEFINSFNDKYETILGERGVTLSAAAPAYRLAPPF
jgi:ABC-type multidrug transport system fused ATPase/permease subunit